MSTIVAEEPCIIHTLPGRLRIHLPGWHGQGKRDLETKIRQLAGVQSVQASPVTSNILLYFDPEVIDKETLLATVKDLYDKSVGPGQDITPLRSAPLARSVLREKRGPTTRLHIPIRGLDHDPQLAGSIKKTLEHLHPGVHVHINMLTGHVVVDFTEHEAKIDDILSTIVGMDLPEVSDEKLPTNPLNPIPLIESAIHTVGAALGLGVLAVRRLLGLIEPLPGAQIAIQVSSILGILQSIPPVRSLLRRLLGKVVSNAIFSTTGIVALTFAENPLGLAVIGSESLRFLTAAVANRTSWQRFKEREEQLSSPQPDATLHLEAGESPPLAARVIEGTGTAIGLNGLPQAVSPGDKVPSGSRLYGGPFTVKLLRDEAFQPYTLEPHPAAPTPSFYERYQQFLGYASLGLALGTAVVTRSFTQVLTSLLLVNPRVAMIGQENADLGAIARVIRVGVTVIGTRTDRAIRLPNVLFLDGARLLTDGLELVEARPLIEGMDDKALLTLTGNISVAAGSPWGKVFGRIESLTATDGSFNGKRAYATVDHTRYWLGPVEHWSTLPEATVFRQRGNYVLELWDENEQRTVAILAIRPRLAPGVPELVQMCKLSHVELIMLANGDQIATQELARRVGVFVREDTDVVSTIRTRQQAGSIVAFVSDNSAASAAFAASDLAIGLIPRHNQLYARADLLAPDLDALTAIIEAGARREAVVRDAIGFSLISNIVGAILRFTSTQNLAIAGRTSFIAALGAITDAWLRMRGGERAAAGLTELVDPHPERWGQRSIPEVLSSVKSTKDGLSTTEARKRRQQALPRAERHQLLTAIIDQVSSPLIGILAAGAGLSLLLGSVGDVAIIAFTIFANVAVGSWQEFRADRMAETLQRLGTSSARVLRDGVITTIPATEVVVGDILVLTHGDRLAADARVISAQGLEVDEAALTGESFPVPKMAEGGADSNHVILAGSDVSTGTGRAVVVAAGRQTRMGATMAALSKDELEHSPLGMRLTRMLRFVLPISVIGGAIVILSGLIWGQPLAPLLATGATIALAGVPEGLPLLTKVSEAGVARRLADRQAIVRRLTAVEALGRVDIACTDKTGTLTRGRLAISLVANLDQEAKLSAKLPAPLRYLLTTAAYASPHPAAPDANSHPTDIAVIQGALDAGLEKQIYEKHDEELPFDPRRAFHASMVQGRLCLKGAPEALIPRCSSLIRRGKVRPMSDEDRLKLQAMSRQFAGRGLRMLFVAEGHEPTSLDDPQGLTALGFVGISDPLRSTVQAAVRRCQNAGVRVIMITGDHPATARAIAQETGLIDHSNGQVITGAQMADLSNEELAEHLEHTAVIARATPLDKVRIVDCLKLHGHTVAMTGDGVNDAPALRLADVGVAMGGGSTEVARQTADVVIANDDFSTLVETFVEGRSFWHNIRRALGLLLGGNLGELVLVVGASIAGLAAPLNIAQILAMNAITDTLPAVAVALQQPEHHNLAELRREGTSALGRPLLYEMVRRAITSAIPSFIAYVLMLGTPGGLMEARAVAYTSIITTQLAQTLEVGRTEKSLSRSVLAAVAGSAGVLAATLTIPPLRDFLNLVLPSPFGWAVIGAGTLLALILSYVLDAIFARRIAQKQAPARPAQVQLAMA